MLDFPLTDVGRNRGSVPTEGMLSAGSSQTRGTSMDYLKLYVTFLLQMLVGTRAACLLKACLVLEAQRQEVRKC